MMRYAIVTKVEVYAGDDLIGEIAVDNGIGYKAKLNDTFMSKKDICFVGKVLDYMEENGDIDIEETI